ncbi:MAG TPA: L,D-transpeptidase [Gemmatimonadaceae bacterium]
MTQQTGKKRRLSRRAGIGIAAAAILVAGATFVSQPRWLDRALGAVIPGASADDASQPVNLWAITGTHELYIMRGQTDTVHIYDVATGTTRYPTPKGTFRIRKIVWNPGWTPPPDADWARGKRARGPGDPGNPMKVAKIFFKEPDYYIHGTGDTNSLGWDASHGCIRMHPDDVARVAQVVMNAGGVAHDWDWVKRTLHIGDTRTINLKQPVTLTVAGDLPEFLLAGRKPAADPGVATGAGAAATSSSSGEAAGPGNRN